MLFPTLPLPDLKTLLPSGKPGVEEAGGAPDASGRRAVEPAAFLHHVDARNNKRPGASQLALPLAPVTAHRWAGLWFGEEGQ